MSQSSSQSRKRRSTSGTSMSSATGKAKSTTPYSGEFEQKMIDNGVYPDVNRTTNENRPPKPKNVKEIREILSRPRPSLSPSTSSKGAFEDFQDSNRRAKSESKAMANVIPVIAGSKDQQYDSAGDVAFFRLGKSASGKPDVAQRQAMCDGAVGARGMLQLQNYGNPMPVYDGNAYTLAATYSDGQLKMYATHPRPSAGGAGGAEYYTSQLRAYAMTDTPDSFRQGAAAYRNAREWTQQQRDRFIANANGVAQRMWTDTRTGSRTESNSNVSFVIVIESSESDTSADEHAPEYDSNAKRLRRRTHSH
ncbi:Hypothetical protein R9X50_00726200 [Acrodontium crateriforme]|uniref:Uncharacterized protein n=1 Tax=Acrodontium crateriforme TaxID=150365 RepID=A0AAQ3MB76_9PEZI|nr:Hypothetical protein R9X50_00726200 [Acrodontium crateriforme]